MEYRISCAETAEEKEKESNFMGLGLTSRKNLCIHPEVSTIGKRASQMNFPLISYSLDNYFTWLLVRLLGVKREERQSRGCTMSRPHECSRVWKGKTRPWISGIMQLAWGVHHSRVSHCFELTLIPRISENLNLGVSYHLASGPWLTSFSTVEIMVHVRTLRFEEW